MVHFREVQKFRQPWLVVLWMGPLGVLAWGVWQQLVLKRPWGDRPAPDGVLVALGLGVLLLSLWMFRMRLVTEVRDDLLRVHFVLLWKPKIIPFAEIRSFEVVTYRPIIEYGGWGIRRGRNGWAYNVSGNRGVRLELSDGARFLVGSRQPEELARALGERMGLRPR